MVGALHEGSTNTDFLCLAGGLGRVLFYIQMFGHTPVSNDDSLDRWQFDRHSIGFSVKYTSYSETEITIRDMLALDRTRLANERTFLAYLRSALVITISCVTVVKLFPQDRLLIYAAIALAPLALVLLVVGTTHFLRLRTSLKMIEHQAFNQQRDAEPNT